MADEFTPFTPITGDMIGWQGDVGTVNYRSGQVVIFYNKPVLDPAKSRELGRPHKEPVVYIKSHAPGEHNINVIDRPATAADTKRYPVEYSQFMNGQEQIPAGTPIELLYADNVAFGPNMRAAGVHTIEQCAELTGTAIDRIGMGAQGWVNDAKRYLEAAQKGVHYTHMKHELDQRDSEIRTLKHQIEIMQEQLAKLTNQQPQAGVQITQAQLAQLLSGMMQNPQFPPPGVPQSKAFDVQSVQIAATHPSADEAAARRKPGRPRKVSG